MKVAKAKKNLQKDTRIAIIYNAKCDIENGKKKAIKKLIKQNSSKGISRYQSPYKTHKAHTIDIKPIPFKCILYSLQGYSPRKICHNKGFL